MPGGRWVSLSLSGPSGALRKPPARRPHRYSCAEWLLIAVGSSESRDGDIALLDRGIPSSLGGHARCGPLTALPSSKLPTHCTVRTAMSPPLAPKTERSHALGILMLSVFLSTAQGVPQVSLAVPCCPSAPTWRSSSRLLVHPWGSRLHTHAHVAMHTC